jgi:CDP-diacylglycerol--serine O-phosphatidyltransferase
MALKRIYLLPNFITSLNLLCGYWSLTFSMKQSFVQAAVMIYFSLIFDTLDGRIARMTQTTSRFGLEFDSLTDAISFGIAPACIIYNMYADNMVWEFMTWWACFLFVVCGILRLARYNVQANTEEKVDFTGLPTPCAAGVLGSYVLFELKYAVAVSPWVILPLMLILAFLMVSRVPYSSFSNIDLKKQNSFYYLVLAVVCVGLLVRFPQQILLCVFLGYIVSGPINILRKPKGALVDVNDED